METVVVQAHPLDDSLSVALLDAVVKGLQSKGVEPRVLRLSDGAALDASAFTNARHLVMVYPTWWGSTPAMLLGPLVDLVGPWVDDGLDRVTSPLRSVERLTVVTSHGSSRLMNLAQGEPGRHLWQRTVLGLCADAATFEWLALYKLDRIGHDERVQFISEVTAKLAT